MPFPRYRNPRLWVLIGPPKPHWPLEYNRLYSIATHFITHSLESLLKRGEGEEEEEEFPNNPV